MKIEIEIKDELVNRFGREAIRIYLTRKAEKLEELLNQNTDPENDTETDAETLKDSWAKFNKRGMSC